MKKPLSPHNALWVCLLLVIPALSRAGNGDDVEKRKLINKSYTVTSSDKLSIDNSFGDVTVGTWDKNEIKVDVEIYVEAGTEEKAQRMIDNIDVTDSRVGNLISFKTDVDKEHEKNHKKENGNLSFHINYSILMPSGNPLDVQNQFGKIKIGDFDGEVNLTSKFGGLTSGNLKNVSDVDVEFGEASLGNINNGKLTLKFDGKSRIGKVSGNVKINIEFSGTVQFALDNSFDGLTLTESYSSVRLVVPKDFSARFQVHTNFGDFHNHTDMDIREDRDSEDDNGPRFDKDYSGKSGDGKSLVKIKSSFGNISLTNTADNDNSGDEEHSKKEGKKDKTSI